MIPGEALWAGILYSFLGWLLEVAFAQATRSPKRDRKCCFVLPLCPVYGLGALAILALPSWVGARWWLLWIAGGLAATVVEGALGLFYRGALGVEFWDYRALPGNLKGLVCPLFGLIWGGLGVGLRLGLHPLLSPALRAVPAGWTGPAALILSLDAFATLAALTAGGSPNALRWYATNWSDQFKAFPDPEGSPPRRAWGESRPPEQ